MRRTFWLNTQLLLCNELSGRKMFFSRCFFLFKIWKKSASVFSIEEKFIQISDQTETEKPVVLWRCLSNYFEMRIGDDVIIIHPQMISTQKPEDITILFHFAYVSHKISTSCSFSCVWIVPLGNSQLKCTKNLRGSWKLVCLGFSTRRGSISYLLFTQCTLIKSMLEILIL